MIDRTGSTNTRPLRVVQVSDTHLSPRTPEATHNWNAVVEYVRATSPDLVINTGDLSLNGADDEADLEFALAAHQRLDVPWKAVAGNHDLGDIGTDRQPIDAARRTRFARVFGDSFWTIDLNGWRLVGGDIQTLLSDLADAPDHWAWLESAVDVGGPVALFIHRPVMPVEPDELDEPERYVTRPHRERLQALLDRADVRLVATGHVHQARMFETDGCRHVWAPSTWASLPDTIQPTIGTKMCGIVEHRFDGDVTSTVVVPPGMADYVIGIDINSPYSH